MNRIATVTTLIALMALSACAQQQNWSPTLDTSSDPHANRISADLAQCKDVASKAADQAGSLLESGGIGTVAGAAGGALIGAMVGAPAMGAGYGAAAGAGLGLGHGAMSSDDTYRSTYTKCMQNRGHTVLN